MPAVKDRKGTRYGRLVALEYIGKRYWKLQCDCGNTAQVFGPNLDKGHVTSCGCYRRERAAKLRPAFEVGEYGTSEYLAWRNMMVRCYKPWSHNYKHYGARGIKVCDRWHKFENFYLDMGDKPSPDLSLERVDVNGDYCPENCKWATMKEQQNNRRNTGRNKQTRKEK